MNGYLHKIKAAESDKCECGAVESIPHFLFACLRWLQYRRTMREAHGSRWGDLSFALGGHSGYIINRKEVDGDIKNWKPCTKAVKATIGFARATKRLEHTAPEVYTSQLSQE